MRRYYYVDKVGVELEGGWDNPRFDTEEIGSDGSVNVEAQYNGETASPPLLPAKIGAWMVSRWPSAVNSTCGLHVHMSFQRLDGYSRLVTPGFQDFLVERLRAWGTSKSIIPRHPFWSRLNGNNNFCKLEYHPEKQLYRNNKAGDRYTFVNYCWGLHRTLEVRGLPGFKMLKIGQSAVLAVVDAAEDFLRLRRKYERRSWAVRGYLEHPTPECIEESLDLDLPEEPTITENMEV